MINSGIPGKKKKKKHYPWCCTENYTNQRVEKKKKLHPLSWSTAKVMELT